MANTTADGRVVLSVDMNVGEAEKKLNKLTSDIEKNEKKIRDITSKRGEVEEKGVLDAAALDAEKAKLKDLKDTLADLKAMSKDKSIDVDTRANIAENISAAQQDLSDQQARVRALQAEYNKTENAVARYNSQLAEANNTLEVQKIEAGALEAQIDKANAPAAQFGKRMREAGDGVDYLQSRIKRLASRVMVFSVITMALRGMREWMGKIVKSNDEARKSMAKLKGALLTLAQPLVNVIVPAFIQLVNIATQAVNALADLVSNIFGTTAQESAEAAKKLKEEQDALNGVGKSAKKAANQLASFDEVNKIGETEKTSVETIEPEFVDAGISSIESRLLTDLGLLAIGALLTFTGANVLLGIGMMALGAYGLYKEAQENPSAVKNALDGWIGSALVIAGFAAIAIGAILAFSGVKIPLGIFLIALGAATLYGMGVLAPDQASRLLNSWIGDAIALVGFTALVIGVVLAFSGAGIRVGIALIFIGASMLFAEALLAPDKMKAMLNDWLGEAILIVGMVALVIGVVLAFSAVSVKVGIAFMATGALLLMAGANLAPDKMKSLMNDWLGDAIVIVGMVALVIGVVLAFSMINLPLGIALIALGAGALFAEAIIAPDKMKEMLGGWLGTALIIGGIVAIVLGIILLLTPATLPLGIALIALGAGAFVTGIAAKWDSILDILKGIWDDVSNWWNTNVAKWFTLEHWAKLGDEIMAGLFDGLKKGWEAVVKWAADATDWLLGLFTGTTEKIQGSISEDIFNKGKQFKNGFSGSRSVASNVRSASVSIPEPPYLATGAVIPPNREFMAVLGDQKRGYNVEAPADLIRQMVTEGMRAAGGGYAGRNLTVVLQLDRRELGRTVFELNNEQTQIHGVNLAGVRR